MKLAEYSRTPEYFFSTKEVILLNCEKEGKAKKLLKTNNLSKRGSDGNHSRRTVGRLPCIVYARRAYPIHGSQGQQNR